MLDAAGDNLHSRAVFWLKILLPLAALAALSTLFLVPRNVRPEDAIPYARVDITKRANDPRLTGAAYAGMTADGATLTVNAAEVRPGISGTANAGLATGILGHLATPDGARTDMTAGQAQLDQAAQLVTLSGGVVVTNSLGYRVETPGLRVRLDQTALDSDGPVKVSGPLGQIEAASMHLGLSDPAKHLYLLVFNGNVRLLYQPLKQGD